ncbi:MAG: SBBP repeat-containing protein, partial [Deltaproteobacteria bacterium]|nr:SBBP repeat-containing protein [Deltaproteobacteria bacterium]
MLQFTSGGHVLGFDAEGVYVATGDHMLRVEFVGHSGVAPMADGKLSGDGPAQPLGRVTYADLWPGISLNYDHVAGSIAQSSYLLEPGADVSQVRLRYNAPVEIEAGGSLWIEYETGHMRESAPVAWQEINSRRIPVEVTFFLFDSTGLNPVVGFSLGQYDTTYSVTIDPALTWHTFMGSESYDGGYAIAVDGSGNVYVAGSSTATWGSPVNAHAGGYDAFAAKLNSSGVRQWHTFMGSADWDDGFGI